MDISGSFDVLGESGTGYRDEYSSLIRFFWSDFNRIAWEKARLEHSSHVTFVQQDNKITVSAWDNATGLAEREFVKGEENGYQCTAEGISLKGVGPSVHGLVGFIGQNLTFFKAGDGSLTVKVEESGGGLALVIPAYGNETHWKRYRPYHKGTSKNSYFRPNSAST
jgi:hypothetical protein